MTLHPITARSLRLTRRRATTLFTDDSGAATAEYAIATMATVAGSGQYVSAEARWLRKLIFLRDHQRRRTQRRRRTTIRRKHMTEATEPLRIAIYVRQSVREDQGITQQIEECTRRAASMGWHVVDVYNDNNTSATKSRGAGTQWARMLADIDAGRIDAVVATKVARLLRRTVDVLELTMRRVRVIITGEGMDTSNHIGKALLTIIVALAENEIEEKESRAVPYRAARRKEGHPSPGKVPYGYTWVPELNRDTRGTRYMINQHEARVLKYMSKELLSAANEDSALGGIVAALNAGEAKDDDGPLGQDSRTTRAGARWDTTTARRLLLSPFPAGLLPPKTPDGQRYDATKIDMAQCTPGAWEAILSEDAVLAARGILMNQMRRKHDGNTRAKWLLTGVGRCGKCGGPLRSCKTKTTTVGERAYRCTAGCFQRPAALIETYVSEAVVSALSESKRLIWVPDDGADLKALTARLSALKASRAEWFERVKAGTMSPAEWDALVAQHDSDIHDLQASISRALQADPLAEIVTSEDVAGLWDRMSVVRRRAVLVALVHNVRVHPVGKGRRIRSMEEMATTVTMNWRRLEHRRSLVTGETTRTPRVPDSAREPIVLALN